MSYLLLQSDARSMPMADASVQAIVTSPPYWRLRNYGSPHQIGHESFDDYLASLMSAFYECWRVLRPDGALWLQIGDRYSSGGRGGGGRFMAERGDKSWAHRKTLIGWQSPPSGFKPKELLGIPWRLALALQSAGWYLRADIIWQKPNAKPESCRDRTTLSHEYLFLLTKQSHYYWDASGMREEACASERRRRQQEAKRGIKTLYKLRRDQMSELNPVGRNGSFRSAEARQRLSQMPDKNRRSVWTLCTERGVGTHSATFPLALPERCILASTRPGDIVLDPFAGTSTTGIAALRHGRRYVGLEVNQQYIETGLARIARESWIHAAADARMTTEATNAVR